ncbi:mas-related G-protein coupled receptor member X2-like [Perognathus longimembris pacificus]|uniref:mas-related G-protein coupled receptor member X2-like n=1 Tax=Perognathus longimembris pacificus TaxID=214514 RepID=UPI00201904F7|nr:mas-related G-protein coupled receptor member X2-like [Perognathus longimembris pacificus]
MNVEATTLSLMTDMTRTMTSNYKHISPGNCVMEKTILQCFGAIIAVIGLEGNAAVIWLLGLRIPRKAIWVCILNLAVADFLSLCFQFIYYLHEFTSYFLHSMGDYSFHAFRFLFFYLYIAGLGFLSVISLERCLSVLCPIWYRSQCPRQASSFMCVLLWVLPVPFSSLLTHYCPSVSVVDYGTQCELSRLSADGYLLLLFVIVSGASLAMTVRMFCGSLRMSLTRLYVTVLLSVLVYIFCGLCFPIFSLLKVMFSSHIHHFDCYLNELLDLLDSGNRIANPVIYFFVDSFRQVHWLSVFQSSLPGMP